jgi:DNA-binding CsgD family transcriptional regulator
VHAREANVNKRFRDAAAAVPGSEGSSENEGPPVLIVDSVRRCVEANDAASRLLGLTRSQLVGQDVDNLRLPEGHLLVLPRIADPSDTRGGDVRRPAIEGGAERRSPSKREREVLTLLARGSTDVKIAETLGLSPATVQTHVRNAKAKLGARTRAQAVALALVGNLIELD